MESFYGGKQGYSFVIKKSYKAVEEMITDFTTDNCEVGYHQYAIINTEDKNNIHNGEIYRRGYDGPILVSSIVGPSGPAPYTTIKGYQEIEQEISSDNEQNQHSQIILTANNNGLIKGKDGDSYNDAIKIISFNKKIDYPNDTNKNGDICKNHESELHIGMQLPVSTFEATAKIIDNPFAEPVAEINHQDKDGNEHLFYNKIEFQIPRGKKGTSSKDFTIKSYTRQTILNEFGEEVANLYFTENEDIVEKEFLIYTEEDEGEQANKKIVSLYKEVINAFIDKNTNMLVIEYSDGKTETIGPVVATNGIYIGANISPNSIKNSAKSVNDLSNSEIINYLEEKFAFGIFSLRPDLRYKIVTVGNDNEDKKFFAYNYLQNVWYYVGAANSSNSTSSIISSTLTEEMKAMPTGTIWFKTRG